MELEKEVAALKEEKSRLMKEHNDEVRQLKKELEMAMQKRKCLVKTLASKGKCECQCLDTRPSVTTVIF